MLNKPQINEALIQHPHRQLLVQKISKYTPFETVLEIGCGTGPNLYLLAKQYPKTRFVGIDINKKIAQATQKFFNEAKLNNVLILEGTTTELEKYFSYKQFDVTFTDAVLMYIDSSIIKNVIQQMCNITQKAIVMCEHASPDESGLGKFSGKWWLRNYNVLFDRKCRSYNEEKIAENVWSGNWAKHGYFIEITL